MPAPIRRELGLVPGDKVSFQREGHVITIRRHDSVVDRTAGILHRPNQQPFSPEDMHRAVEQAIAEDAVKRANH